MSENRNRKNSSNRLYAKHPSCQLAVGKNYCLLATTTLTTSTDLHVATWSAYNRADEEETKEYFTFLLRGTFVLWAPELLFSVFSLFYNTSSASKIMCTRKAMQKSTLLCLLRHIWMRRLRLK